MNTIEILNAQVTKKPTLKLWGIIQECYTSSRISFKEFCQLSKQLEAKGFFNI